MSFCVRDLEADGDGVARLEEVEGDGDFLEVSVGASFVEGEGVLMGGREVGVGSGCALCLPGEGAAMISGIVG